MQNFQLWFGVAALLISAAAIVWTIVQDAKREKVKERYIVRLEEKTIQFNELYVQYRLAKMYLMKWPGDAGILKTEKQIEASRSRPLPGPVKWCYLVDGEWVIHYGQFVLLGNTLPAFVDEKKRVTTELDRVRWFDIEFSKTEKKDQNEF